MAFTRRLLLMVFTLATLAPLPGTAQTSATGVIGNWREPGGAVISVESCGPNVCARLLAITRDAPSTMDGHNPEASFQTRPLCGLTIGTGFHLANPLHAEGGKLYDPKSGKTYNGSMTSDGDTLHLRGYVGLKAFGRTEDWTRTSTPVPACKASLQPWLQITSAPWVDQVG